jgi:hypothetical protein
MKNKSEFLYKKFIILKTIKSVICLFNEVLMIVFAKSVFLSDKDLNVQNKEKKFFFTWYRIEAYFGIHMNITTIYKLRKL